MNKYKILGLTFLLTLGVGANAQQKNKAEVNAQGEVVMTKEELKSFLKMVAEKRLEQIHKAEAANQQENNNVDYYSWAPVKEVKAKAKKKNCKACDKKPGQGDLVHQIERVNDRLDNLMLALIGKGAGTTTVVSSAKEVAKEVQALDNNTADQISALEEKIDSLKSMKSNIDSSNEGTIYISPERRSVLEELLAKYKNFKRQVFFANDSYAVSKEDLAYIDNVVRVLKQNPELSVVLVGYASTVGSPEYNKQLSMKRSESVASSITKRGISKERIISGFYGEDKDSSEAKARRVDMTVVIK